MFKFEPNSNEQPCLSRRNTTAGFVIVGCYLVSALAVALQLGPGRLAGSPPLLIIAAALPMALPAILIEERRLANRALLSRQQGDVRKLRLAQFSIDNSPIAMFWLNADGRVLYGNDAACRTLGYRRSQLLALSVFDFLPDWPAAAWGAFFKTVRESGRDARKSHCRCHDGRLLPVDLSARHMELDGEELLLVTAVSLEGGGAAESQNPRMEEYRQRQKMESLGALAGGVAHDINNPICGIINYAYLIRDDLAGEPQVREFAGEIVRESERIATLVRNLLMYARPDGAAPAPVQVPEIVHDTLSLVRTMMRHDQITMQIDVPQGLPRILCHAQQIQQVMVNLMTNARDALNERYPGHNPAKKLLVTARTITRDGAEWVRTTVEDHGTGIDPEIRARIFDPFFTTRSGRKACGLGLSISRDIVREHGGELTFDTEVNRFTRFHIDMRAQSAA